MASGSKETALRRQKQLLGHFLNKEHTLSVNPKDHIKCVSVYGAGVMGGGIAQVVAAAGYKVTLWDMQQSDIDHGIQAIRKSLERLAKKQAAGNAATWVEATMSRITWTTDKRKAAKQADLIIEAIVESLAIKQALFAELDKVAHMHCVFATNTSSLLVSDVAALLPRKRRTVALHFFNPVPLMKLVEVAYMDDGYDAALVDLLKAWVYDVGKVPVVCKDRPGFIVNRLVVPFNSEARMLVERGDASVEDVDTAMKLGAGHPMGPFELMDLTGIDVGYHIAKGWYDNAPGLQGDPRFKPSSHVEKMIKDGHLGRKTGQGYYNYKQTK
ncbi:hypothetical protein IW140_005784 [Coemansia sp. RSA 1813]|nr:hypothetical protein EV178_005344 [Coemansia sp. RSA 1646]KAJ1768015.1 hypothetical protein LPJ74_005054 [Coemansia sp. RSA 1843]KAJ2086954.1 hypothetical protein IW138_005301 [Coemansia sp. RSA 986]KAJ2211766.1 hypothetical protein EV179_005203 [Coemansia sp. RSA 487]KAJ2564346.1 hypothetical protein IW140_005784 [Coemansia sp. RSA 1813]